MDYSFLQPKKKFDYSFLNKKPEPTPTPQVNAKTKINTLPDFLGGGSYNSVIGEPNTLLKTPRDYAGVPSSNESERHHIIPVEFGGDSTLDKNIVALGSKAHQRITDGESLISSDYKKGKISLGEARVKIMGLLQKEQDEAKGISTNVSKNLLKGLGDVLKPLIKPFTAEGRKEAEKRGAFGKVELENRAKVTSRVLGKEIKPENIIEELKTVSTQDKELINTLSQEKVAETTAKVFTAPFRFTAGSLATAVTSYALEKTDSNKKYTPKTDAEKLIIGETDIQRLTKQEDLYGTVARGAGVPVALLTIAVVENPFLKGTGISTGIKTLLEKQIAKQGEKYLSKIGTKEIIRIADEAIKTEKLAGKITEQEAIKASESINNFKIKPLKPSVRPQDDPSDVLTQEITKPLTTPKTTKTAPLNFKTAEEYVKAQQGYYHASKNVIEEFKNTDKPLFLSKNEDFGKRYIGKDSVNNKVSVDLGKSINLSNKKLYELFDENFGGDKEQIKKWVDDFNFGLTDRREDVYNWLKQDGYDSAIIPHDWDGAFGEMKSTAIFNPEKSVKTKSQLISEWDKAQVKPQVINTKPLIPKKKPLIKKPIKYIPEEKPVDLRKKVTTERLTSESSVPNRIQDSAISKGLKDTFGETFEHDIITFKDQAKKVGQILDEDPEKAIRIALGKEAPTNGALPESVLMTVVKQAEERGDTELLRRLASEEKGVAQEASLLGARIKMYDQQLEDNAFKNIKEVIDTRKKAVKGNLKEVQKKEISKIKEEIKKVKATKDEWLSFVSSITC